MPERTLHYFWVEHDDPHGPIGYGVTAFDEDDAFTLLDSAGHELYGSDVYRVIKTVSEIPSRIVKERMGPIVVRGVWYPFDKIGAELSDVGTGAASRSMVVGSAYQRAESTLRRSSPGRVAVDLETLGAMPTDVGGRFVSNKSHAELR